MHIHKVTSHCYFAAGSIVMAVDKMTSRWLATGDVDGVVKVWDISSYCIEETGELCTTLPRKLRN